MSRSERTLSRTCLRRSTPGPNSSCIPIYLKHQTLFWANPDRQVGGREYPRPDGRGSPRRISYRTGTGFSTTRVAVPPGSRLALELSNEAKTRIWRELASVVLSMNEIWPRNGCKLSSVGSDQRYTVPSLLPATANGRLGN